MSDHPPGAGEPRENPSSSPDSEYEFDYRNLKRLAAGFRSQGDGIRDAAGDRFETPKIMEAPIELHAERLVEWWQAEEQPE